MGELAKIDSFRKEIALAETIEEARRLSTKGEIMSEMAKKLNIPIKAQNELGVLRVDLERRLRELIEQMFPKGNIKGLSRLNSRDTRLKDVGITYDQSSDAKILKEEDDLVDAVIKEMQEKDSDIITPKTVASKVREKKKEKEKQEKEQIRNEVLARLREENVLLDEIEAITQGWYKLGNQYLYCGSNTDKEFIDFLPKCKIAFADPPYNAGVDYWDNKFLWQQDYLQDIAKIVAVTPGGWNAFNFYNQTKMQYVWEIVCWIKNGMTHGRCGYANFIKTSIFSKGNVKIPQDFFSITINVNETEDTSHKGRKPYDYMIKILNTFTDKGDYIIDPFSGSGTTLLICEQMERVSFNAEIDKDFCIEIIKRAISNELNYVKYDAKHFSEKT